MTDPQDPDSVENASNSAGEPTDSISDITPLDAETEALVINALATLPPVSMPENVHDRLIAALAAEPNPYAADVAAVAATSNVTSMASRRERRSGWLVSVVGVAAASVIALVVGTTMLDNDANTNPPMAAAAIPMSSSTKQYQRETFATEVKAALSQWRAKAASPEATKDAEEPLIAESPSVTASGSSTPTPATSPSTVVIARVGHQLREQVAGCLARVSDRMPMHVEIAMYRTSPGTPPERIAVAAVDGPNRSVEVYAISVDCDSAPAQIVREHVTVSAP